MTANSPPHASRPSDAHAGSPASPEGGNAAPGQGAFDTGDGRPDVEAAAGGNGAPAGADVRAALEAARAEAAELRDAWLRARADAENFRRQAALEREKTRKYAIESFAESLLPVRDSLEAALADASATPDTLRSGVELTLRQLASAFEKAQVAPIDPAGEKFDPHRHQAMTTTVVADLPPSTVVQVFQKGYLLQDRVLRPALVSVSKGPDGA